MANLAAADVERCKFHLGYTSRAVPIGDEVILNSVFADNGKTTEWVTFCRKLLDRCDRVFDKTELDQQDSGVAYRRNLTGDRNYSDIEYRAEARSQRERAYIKETDRLARYLGVQNYNNPDNFQYLNSSAIRN